MKTDAQLYMCEAINVIYIEELSTRGFQIIAKLLFLKTHCDRCKSQKETTLRLVEAMMPEETISQ